MDYEFLRFIWWLLVGVLLIGFAVTDGFDMGVGALLKVIGRDDTERRILINAVAPHWDGNQVWLITAGGALFAAWPPVYATAFSGFYLAMMLTLAALFLRPIGFDYRSKLDNAKWRSNWDWALFIGSAVPPIVFGVAFGNLLQGVPFEFNQFMMLTYHGNFFGLLNPFGILAGLVSLFMLVTQGATWLMMKTEGPVEVRARRAAPGHDLPGDHAAARRGAPAELHACHHGRTAPDGQRGDRLQSERPGRDPGRGRAAAGIRPARRLGGACR